MAAGKGARAPNPGTAPSATPAPPAAPDADRSPLAAAHYNLACILALASAGRSGPDAAGCAPPPADAARLRDAAFDHLRSARDLGFADAAHLAADSDLEPLHSDARWPELLASLRK